ncbi:Protein arginine N-methyltransferase 2 [Triplophysa tibetana]|uniref:Protein arginine N-methyltransferase 2 n=1 Tax=Triplophysa tibetana TaxID=1572043 RepID=A0A5A9NYQ9_9TELE|nr:Protein arginine N-methyltransferase 2 [Triplophysa tibetana]
MSASHVDRTRGYTLIMSYYVYKVYAVEASSMVQHTEELVRQNGCEGQERAENLTLPEKVDVLVSEWMANCLLV